MLTELCQELRNWFELEKHFDTFTIEGGIITAPFLLNGQYYRIVGSVFNDGVHKFGTDVLQDETFTGAVWALGIPKAVLDLADRIEDWQDKYGSADSAALSPFMSESFGGYSYSKGVSGSQSGSSSVTWKTAFAGDLNRWRKI